MFLLDSIGVHTERGSCSGRLILVLVLVRALHRLVKYMYIDAGIVMLMSMMMMMAIGMRSFYGRGLDGMAYSEYIGRIEIVCSKKRPHQRTGE